MNIKDDFTILRNNPSMTYLDSACVSLKPDVVVDKITEYYYEYSACAGRSAHKLAIRVDEEVEKSRKAISKLFHVSSKELLFTRNTTEGINLVANTIKPDVVLTTDKEHNSNHVPWVEKAKKLVRVKTNSGLFDLEAYKEILDDVNVDLVSVNHVSNLDGVENPVKKIIKYAHKKGVRVLVDGAQSAGHIPVDITDLGADFYAFSGHKMMGPSGTGVLYVKKKLLDELPPFLMGGDTVQNTFSDKVEWNNTPNKFEAGLQNYAGMIGLGQASSYIRKLNPDKIRKHCQELITQLKEEISKYDVKILGCGSSVLSIIPRKLHAHDLSLLLNGYDIYTRSGAFCVHSYFNDYNLPAAVRFSVHAYNTLEDINRVSDVLSKLKELF